MRPLLAWARANPIIVLCIAAVPICVAAIIYTAMTGSGLVSEKQKVANRWIKKLESLQRTSVQVPTDDPNEPMKQVSLTITDGAIKQLRRVRDGMDGEYLRILNYVIQRNRDGLSFAHVPMLEGLFPGNNLAETEAGLPFAAQRIYKRTLYEFTLANDAQATGPHLNAGGPLAVDLIAEELERVAEDFRAGFGGQVDADVAQENRKLLHGQQSERLVNLLNERARLIHIYADVPQPDEQNRGEFIFSEQTPFHLGEWAVNSNKPTLEQLWEGQVDLWIQQDIVEAIALSNAGSNNVLDAPIKRLIKIDISPGYVGMGSDGGVVNFESGPTRSRSRRPGIAMRRDMFPPGRMGGPRGMPGMRGFGGAMNMSTDDEAEELAEREAEDGGWPQD